MTQERQKNGRTADVVVVGGGLAGLTAAAKLARGGRAVRVLERARELGGRAATESKDGFSLNLGPHALYRGNAAMRTLRELGIEPKGGTPGVSGGLAVDRGRLHTLPGGFLSLLTTSLTGVGGKLEIARLLGSLAKLDATKHDRTAVIDWIEASVSDPAARRLLAGLARLTTYSADPRQSAGVVIRQIQSALSQNVLYVDGGWATLVDSLHEAAARAGAEITTDARATAVERSADAWRIRLADGRELSADAVVLAVDPETSSHLLPASPSLARAAAAAVPVRAACLEIGLSELPSPRATFAIGLDRPVYFSVHSAVAKLAPEGRALLHLARYLEPGEPHDPAAHEKELLGLLDLVQPGAASRIVLRRWLPTMTVAQAGAPASSGGLEGRPAVAVADAPGVSLAGDWVGGEGLLADAALASGAEAARRILAGAALRRAA